MRAFRRVKKSFKTIVPSIDELANVMAPEYMGNLFDSINELTVQELEKTCFNQNYPTGST